MRPAPPSQRGLGPTHRGLGLIEVLVALLVLSFGLFTALRLQAWLRTSGDLAHERAEAVRQAQQSLERLRGFNDLPAFDHPPAEPATIDAPSTRFETERRLADAHGLRTGQARIEWLHRDGEAHDVQLLTGVARLSPVYAAALALPPQGRAVTARQALPPGAGLLPDGRGVVRPVRNASTVWIVNPATGEITGRCNLVPGAELRTLREADLQRCEDFAALLVQGHVRFSLRTPPDPVQANDSSLPTNVVAGATRCDSEPVTAGGERYLAYACAVPRPPPAPELPTLVPRGWTLGTTPGTFKACRYPRASEQAPLNLLVLPGESPCPTLPTPHNGAPATTVQHQP